MTIASPENDQVFQRGEAITFALAAPVDPSHTVSWESSLDRALGEGSQLELQNLRPGTHTVTVRVDGAAAGTVRIQVEDRPSWNLGLLGQVTADGEAVSSDGDLLAVACSVNESCTPGVLFFDISNPAAPVLRSEYRPADLNPLTVFVSGDLVAVGGDSESGFMSTVGVRLLDLTDPADPRVLASITSVTEVQDVFIAEGFLYVAAVGSVFVFDVRDPGAPLQVAEIPAPRASGQAFAVAVAGSRLFALFWNDVPLVRSDILVADVSVPSAPVVLGSVLAGRGLRMGVSSDGRLAFAPDLNNKSVHIYDVSNPGNIRLAAEYRSLPGTEPRVVVVEGNRAFVSMHGGLGFGTGVEVLDISTPARPKLIGYFDLDTSGTAPTPWIESHGGGVVFAIARPQLHVLGFQ
ncbi:MAG TPA: hypothetical protein VMR66_05830 [Gemmatimonadota bacterium]|nr:hypothetical protein [Gemmatimonadota bacterium]